MYKNINVNNEKNLLFLIINNVDYFIVTTTGTNKVL